MRSPKILWFFTAALAACVLSGCAEKNRLPGEAVRAIAVQHNGRIKAFESFARQSLGLISDKGRWQGKGASRAVLEAAADPGTARKTRWIRVQNPELRRQLGLEDSRSYFSYDELMPVQGQIIALLQSSQSKREGDLRPSLLEQKAENLYSRLLEVRRLTDLESLQVVPPASGDAWLSPAEGAFGKPFLRLLEAVRDQDQAKAAKLAEDWKNGVEFKTGGLDSQKIRLELVYHDLRPFHWAWIAYLSAFILISVFGRRHSVLPAGVALAVAAFGLHTTGLILRVLILGRPPVSNMYESVVYMNWVLMAGAGLLALFRRQAVPASIGALVSAVIMIYGDLLPIDSSLEVLVPVLRSNYWLTIHVMTIVSSYGVLGLAMGFGHRHLVLSARRKLNKKEERTSEKLIARTIQIGTLLLGIGTTLGGVWANESWGRFWGWDPKETWALITFLGYLIVLHLHFFRHLSAFALAVSSVVGFQLVLMTWYGVNFVLGRGLHSYGQGSGGAMWIVYYLIAESAFLAWVFWKKKKKA